jgi:hypothetical protein
VSDELINRGADNKEFPVGREYSHDGQPVDGDVIKAVDGMPIRDGFGQLGLAVAEIADDITAALPESFPLSAVSGSVCARVGPASASPWLLLWLGIAD